MAKVDYYNIIAIKKVKGFSYKCCDIMFRKKLPRFFIGSYRKLEIMLLIFRGYCSVDTLLPKLPVCRSTLYQLLRNYRVQGLIRKVEEKGMSKRGYGGVRLAITHKGMRWLGYMLLKEYCLLKERGLSTAEIDCYIDWLLTKLRGMDFVNYHLKVLAVRRGGLVV